jgi:hypothetical protein
MKKIKQPRKVRNLDVMEMILTRKGGPHRDRREKRSNNPKNISWD